MARVEMPNSLARSAIAKRSRFCGSGRFTLGRPLAVLLAEFFLTQLADQGLGQRVLEDDLARHFELVDLFGKEFLELGLGGRLPLLELDEGHRRLAAVIVG